MLELARLTEDEARTLIEQIRWPNGPVCPHCRVINNSVRLGGSSTRPGVFKCRDCHKQYTVTVNTIMHRSKIPLSRWLMAFRLMCSSKKGVSALQLKRELGLGSYQAAWHMTHRVRYAIKADGLAAPLSRDFKVVDETDVGGEVASWGCSTIPKKHLWVYDNNRMLAEFERTGGKRRTYRRAEDKRDARA